ACPALRGCPSPTYYGLPYWERYTHAQKCEPLALISGHTLLRVRVRLTAFYSSSSLLSEFERYYRHPSLSVREGDPDVNLYTDPQQPAHEVICCRSSARPERAS